MTSGVFYVTVIVLCYISYTNEKKNLFSALSNMNQKFAYIVI